MTKRPTKTKVEVRELEPELLSAPSDTATTTDQPVSEETRQTIGAALLKAVRAAREDLASS